MTLKQYCNAKLKVMLVERSKAIALHPEDQAAFEKLKIRVKNYELKNKKNETNTRWRKDRI